MHQYKVFRQIADHSFIETAQCALLVDAESVLANYLSGMITDRGIIIQTKNLTSEDDLRLPITI